MYTRLSEVTKLKKRVLPVVIFEALECILIFEVYLGKDGVESPDPTMDVRCKVYHLNAS